MADTGLQLRSELKEDGTLELSLVDEPIPELKDDEVLVKVQAAPINPSDLGLLFGPADMSAAKQSGTADRPVISVKVPDNMMRAMAARVGQSLPAGNEGAGEVIAAGSSDIAQGLMGKTVAILGGAMYAEYRVMKAKQCLPMHDGVTAKEGASCFVNPLTALGFVETMKLEGHTAMVHTAAASNLGQMLVKICQKDDIPLVNVVRKQEQVDLLKGIGAKYVVNSSDDDFMEQIIEACAETNATLAFDATGGGKLGGYILTAMEQAAQRNMKEFSRYGSDTFKQLYIYGGLDTTPTTFNRGFGFSWSIGGWLLTPFLQKIGPAESDKLRQRVADEVKTTFASSYTAEVSLPEMLTLDAIKVYEPKSTGAKYLVVPNG